MGSVISEWVLEFVADFPIDARREPLQAKGRTRDVTTQTVKTHWRTGTSGMTW
jgi:hypothetical protein